jgi:aminoglycoside phosphotransferase (APT) family kinase protein
MDVNRRIDLPSEDTVFALLGKIAPGSVVLAIASLPGSYSNYTHMVKARSADGSVLRVVIRRYAEFGHYDRGEKARREFKTLELLQRNGIPVPQPLYLDEQGAMLGTPGIVTGYVPGAQIALPSDPLRWARSTGTMLAKIHAVPCDTAARGFLLDANSEASWFLRQGFVPDYMKAHPEGPRVWQTVHDLWPHMQQAPVGLVHIDYWSGNILWDAGRIVAVVDWEEAAYGDPGIDVAYCRMDMFLSGMSKAADEFLSVYEMDAGRRVANLGLWELAAAARPMFNPQGWITESPAKERFSQFIADARKRADH